MNDDRRRDDEVLTPAEERLLALLTLLRAETPPSDPGLTSAVMRTARWQLVVRGMFRAVGGFATVTADAFAVLLGIRPGSKGK